MTAWGGQSGEGVLGSGRTEQKEKELMDTDMTVVIAGGAGGGGGGRGYKGDGW